MYANQNYVYVRHEKVSKGSGKNRPYTVMYNDNIKAAMKDLKGTEFKVYMFICMNGDGFKFEFSPQLISNEIGISTDSARNAFKTLKEKGYIIIEEGHVYYFYERKQEQKPLEWRYPTTGNAKTYEMFALHLRECGFTEDEIKARWAQCMPASALTAPAPATNPRFDWE